MATCCVYASVVLGQPTDLSKEVCLFMGADWLKLEVCLFMGADWLKLICQSDCGGVQ